MKIKLSLSQDSVDLLAKLLDRVYQLNISMLNMEGKAMYTIGFTLADKFDKKNKQLKKKANLLNTNDLVQLTLPYHEAFALYGILKEFIGFVANHRDVNTLRILINTLDQKLT